MFRGAGSSKARVREHSYTYIPATHAVDLHQESRQHLSVLLMSLLLTHSYLLHGSRAGPLPPSDEVRRRAPHGVEAVPRSCIVSLALRVLSLLASQLVSCIIH